MPYLIFGLATGTLVCGLIAKYHDKESSWINPSYLFGLSGILYALFILVGWPLLKGLVV